MTTCLFRIAIWVIALSALGAACAPGRYAQTNKQYNNQVKALSMELRAPLPPATPQPEQGDGWVGAIHFNLRKPNFVIIHHTAQDSLAQTLHTFTVPHSEVSAHYVIGRDGEVYQMLSDYLRGWHAGAGKWGSITDLNSVSLGIELDNNGSEPFPPAQIQSLVNLLDTLKQRYNIPAANFIGHADIAPTRKQDPSALFPWEQLAKHGFGLWPDEPLATPPAHFNAEDALRIIGYDTINLDAAIVAFKRHYVQNDLSATLTPHDLRVLYSLYRKR